MKGQEVPAVHASDETVEMRVTGASGSEKIALIFRLQVCAEHKPDLAAAIQNLGFRASVVAVGPHAHGSYVAASGAPFTASQARAWLRSQGHRVARAGRLTHEQLRLYGDCH